MKFEIDARLLEDSIKICDLELSTLLLKNDKENPWFVLVPRRFKASEIIDLNSEEQGLLMEEISLVSNFVKEYYEPFKINVANLGNVVPQLHIHIIARYESDRAFPNPIWNTQTQLKFEPNEFENVRSNFIEYIE